MTGTFQLQAVKVRMYRPGLGDCFLLTFIGHGGETRYMLIDCGVLQQTKGGSDRLLQIVNDIKGVTGGTDTTPGKLHIIAATHEHADHLAGFDIHRTVFTQAFDIDEVWMAWTEDKTDSAVSALYSSARQTPLEALRAAKAELEKAGSPFHPYLDRVLAFVSAGQMDSLKTLGRQQRYLRPKAGIEGPTTVIAPDDLGSVRFHVLGPPEDPKALVKGDLPKDKNQLRLGEAINQATAFTAALRNMQPAALDDPAQLDIDEIYNLCLPFDKTRARPIEQARDDPFFVEYYGFSDEAGHGAGWRRIDTDWLEAAGELALDLDANTNNTSLVLAIELSPGGKVLLFPADAQHGNWLSWAKTPKATDLLHRTVFYKVGHHGSNNATLIPGGLDQMSSPDLVAMMPVDPVRAPNFKMPNPALKARLLAQTQGRLILACEGQSPEQPCPCVDFKLPAEKPGGLAQAEWDQFIQAVTWDPSPDRLWVEYTLSI